MLKTVCLTITMIPFSMGTERRTKTGSASSQRHNNEYPRSMFWAEIWKISEFFIWNFHFLVVKFLIYLNRHVFVMLHSLAPAEVHRPVKSSEQHNLPGFMLLLTLYIYAHTRIRTYTYTHVHRGLYHSSTIRQLFINSYVISHLSLCSNAKWVLQQHNQQNMHVFENH